MQNHLDVYYTELAEALGASFDGTAASCPATEEINLHVTAALHSSHRMVFQPKPLGVNEGEIDTLQRLADVGREAKTLVLWMNKVRALKRLEREPEHPECLALVAAFTDFYSGNLAAEKFADQLAAFDKAFDINVISFFLAIAKPVHHLEYLPITPTLFASIFERLGLPTPNVAEVSRFKAIEGFMAGFNTILEFLKARNPKAELLDAYVFAFAASHKAKLLPDTSKFYVGAKDKPAKKAIKPGAKRATKSAGPSQGPGTYLMIAEDGTERMWAEYRNHINATVTTKRMVQFISMTDRKELEPVPLDVIRWPTQDTEGRIKMRSGSSIETHRPMKWWTMRAMKGRAREVEKPVRQEEE